jgi:hypothetical protein
VVADSVGQAIEDIREVVPRWIQASRENKMSLPPALASANSVSIKFVVPVIAT